jgi:hypothetical protein
VTHPETLIQKIFTSSHFILLMSSEIRTISFKEIRRHQKKSVHKGVEVPYKGVFLLN